jgi:hypothetical protein
MTAAAELTQRRLRGQVRAGKPHGIYVYLFFICCQIDGSVRLDHIIGLL